MQETELIKWRKKFRGLSNSARYDEAYALAKKLKEKHPKVLLFAHYEAVMTAEEDVGYTPAQLKARYRAAARKLLVLLKRTRAMNPSLKKSVRNEYYWFSRQPLKQFKLGVEQVRKGDKYSYYSQGVGAAEMAKLYAQKGKPARALSWAKKSELAWKNYFKVMPKWFNSYFFYAAALGYQGRLKEMDQAYAKAAKIAKKPKNWKSIMQYREEVLAVRREIEKSSAT